MVQPSAYRAANFNRCARALWSDAKDPEVGRGTLEGRSKRSEREKKRTNKNSKSVTKSIFKSNTIRVLAIELLNKIVLLVPFTIKISPLKKLQVFLENFSSFFIVT
jgi:hypothetical protein